jgi:crossover junction endodeoxyribonuclease RuvC
VGKGEFIVGEEITIGIDPGQTGAISAIFGGKVVAIVDMPTCGKAHGKGQEVDAYELSSILMGMKSGREATVIIEQVGAMPGNGSTGMFGFGDSFGVIRGVCGALQLPVRRVRPQHWKRKAGIINKDKDAARGLAIQLHPEVSDQLARKKDCGRADSILIAEFGGI